MFEHISVIYNSILFGIMSKYYNNQNAKKNKNLSFTIVPNTFWQKRPRPALTSEKKQGHNNKYHHLLNSKTPLLPYFFYLTGEIFTFNFKIPIKNPIII